MKVSDIFDNSVKPEFNIDSARELVEQYGFNKFGRLEKAFSIIEKAISENRIISTEFDEVKNQLNSFIDFAFENGIAKKLFYGRGNELPSEVFIYCNSLNELKHFGKKIKKLPNEWKDSEIGNALVKFENDFISFSRLVEWLKGVKVSAAQAKKEKKEADVNKREEYLKKYVSHTDTKKVIKLLTDLTDKNRNDIFNAQFSFWKSIADNIIQLIKQKEFKSFSELQFELRKDEFSLAILSMIADGKAQVLSDWQELLKKFCQDAADQVIDTFIYKVSEKIAFILYSKDNLQDVSFSKFNTSVGKVECDLSFVFKDTAKFNMSTSVIGATSKNGKWFYRYAATFHDATMPNGEKLKNPSEQKMEEEFVN